MLVIVGSGLSSLGPLLLLLSVRFSFLGALALMLDLARQPGNAIMGVGELIALFNH